MYDLIPGVSTPQSSRSATHARSQPLVRLGGLAWALSAVFFVAQLAAQLAFVPAYSLLDDRVSDLGNTSCGPWLTHAFACSPLHALMNTAFVATGVLFVLGAVLTWEAWPRRRLRTAGLACMALAGVGYVLVGLNPENVNVRLHILGASNLFTSNIGLLLLGLSTRHERSWRAWLALGLAGVALLGLLVGPLLLAVAHHGGGLAERLALYPGVVYVVSVGLQYARFGGKSSISSADAVG